MTHILEYVLTEAEKDNELIVLPKNIEYTKFNVIIFEQKKIFSAYAIFPHYFLIFPEFPWKTTKYSLFPVFSRSMFEP